MRPARVLLAAALLVGYGALAACSGATSAPPGGHAHLPGQGEHTHEAAGAPAAVTGPEAAPTPAWSHDDVSYLQMMIAHHGQALDLAELASARATDPRVRAVADRIDAARAPEVFLMAGWLAERGIDVPSPAEDPRDYDHGEHGHHPMRGLLGETDLTALAAAEGAGFDRLFLAAVVRHHEGAITMADDLLAGGTDPRVSRIASAVRAGQAAEITRMRRLLDDLDEIRSGAASEPPPRPIRSSTGRP